MRTCFTVFLFIKLLTNTLAIEIGTDFAIPFLFQEGHYSVGALNHPESTVEVKGHDNQVGPERGAGNLNVDWKKKQVLGTGNIDTGLGIADGTGDLVARPHQISAAAVGRIIQHVPVAVIAAGGGERDARGIQRAGQVPVVGTRARIPVVRPRRPYQQAHRFNHRSS